MSFEFYGYIYIRCEHVAAVINKLYCCFEKRNK